MDRPSDVLDGELTKIVERVVRVELIVGSSKVGRGGRVGFELVRVRGTWDHRLPENLDAEVDDVGQ